MALHFDFTAVPNHETVCLKPDGEIQQVTDMLIWLTLALDLNGITAANVEKFLLRLRMYEVVTGSTKLTEEQVRAHIGLKTNVSNETDAKFAKKITRIVQDRAEQAIYRARQQKLVAQNTVAA